ncbi:hypothetical protein [Solidesulfovibrio sp.]|uniref:hypothetical protein n=1 Tax=Solidesulfovibrio sp. TaxID=2910990 RepID=UPI002B1F39C0|nr:hypothetical protein [Solidesulfovibrio sp.]MEA4854852.1 hypothetical protein [Solidesulfovibrio sp.]
MLHPTATRLFRAGSAVSPSLAAWHRAFADLPPGDSVPVELWFDRAELAPVCERLRLPLRPAAAERRLAGRYVAALVNNILCVHGARAVAVLAPGRETAREVRGALEHHLLLHPERFSAMPLDALHGLIRRVYGTDLAVSDDPGAAMALRERRPAPPPDGVGAPPPPRPGLALAVNIGQHLTRLALVRLGDDGGFDVRGLERLETWPEGRRPCLKALAGRVLARLGGLTAAAGRDIEAVGVSIAATVRDGVVLAVPRCGLFAACPAERLAGAAAWPTRLARQALPGRPVAVVNDGLAQALFAYRHGNGRDDAAPAPERGDLLSVRLGACPSVHRLDGQGRARPGFHEYGWLVTRHNPGPALESLFATLHPALSHFGLALAARELGLLRKYRLSHEAAIPFFYEALGGADAALRRDAARAFGVLGAHLAMLAGELSRHRPLAVIRVLGSRTNRLDERSFAAVASGFAGFAEAQGLGLAGVSLELLEDSSAVAGLVGAAHLALAQAGPAGG